MLEQEEEDRIIGELDALVPVLLLTLESLAHIARHLQPPELAALLEEAAPLREVLHNAQQSFDGSDWPGG